MGKRISIRRDRKMDEAGNLVQLGARRNGEGVTRRQGMAVLANDLKDYMPGPQLVTARHIPGWVETAKKWFTGSVALKRIRRLCPELNPAMVSVDAPDFQVIVDDGLTIDGQVWVSPDIMNAIREALKGHHQDIERIAGVPQQVRITKLRDTDPGRRQAFNSMMSEVDIAWHQYVTQLEFNDAWIDEHAAHPGLGGMFRLAASMENPVKKAAVHDMYNAYLQEVLRAPYKRMQMGRFGEWHTLSFNDALEDGHAATVHTPEISGAGIALFAGGKGFKVFARECADLEPGTIIANSKNAVVDSPRTGLFTIIGTHTKRWLEVNRRTFETLAPKMDGADMDGDSVLVGSGPAAGLMFRMPMTHHQGLVGISIDGCAPHPAGYPWDAPTQLEAEDRPKARLEVNLSMPDSVALFDLARQVSTAWNAVKVGPTNLMLQIGTVLGWKSEELDFIGRMQCYAIDLRSMTRDEICVWHELRARIRPFEDPSEGQVPLLFAHRYPEAHIVATDTDEDHFMAQHDLMVQDLELGFIDGQGEAPVDIDGVVSGDAAVEFFAEFMMSMEDHKQHIRDLMGDSEFDARKERAAFIKSWRQQFMQVEDRKKMAVELVRLHHLNPIYKAWVVDGYNDHEDWARTPDQTLIRVIADTLADILLGSPVDPDPEVEPVEGQYWPVKGINITADTVVLHCDRDETDKKGFWRSRVCVEADGRSIQIGWFKSRVDHRHLASMKLDIVIDGKQAVIG